MKNLIIIGARGFGREVYLLALECTGYNKEFVVAGFLDDHSAALDSIQGFPPIMDSVENYQPKENDRFICALGNVEDKIKYTGIIAKKGGRFTSLIHPSVRLTPSTKIGEGCIIMRNTAISNNVKIGNFVTIMIQSVVGHDAKIGDCSHLGPFVFLGGSSQIDANVQLHVRATVLANIKVGKNAVAGAGSIVLRNVEPGTTVFGNPAKKIGKFK